jgi:dTMP kinase
LPGSENKKTQKGLFITFEGIDGSGKSIQASSLKKNLLSLGYKTSLVRDPGGPIISEQIRNILLDHQYKNMSPITELLLYEAARSQLVCELIRPCLARGEIVISDRFCDSTTAYQGFGRQILPDLVKQANSISCGETLPHKTYIFDIPWNESLRRRSFYPEKADRMEQEMESFFQDVRKGYQVIAREDPGRVRLLDGTKSIASLEQVIIEDVLYMIKELGIPKTGKIKS